MFDNIRIEKIISGTTSRKTNDAKFRKWPKPNFSPSNFFLWVLPILVRNCCKLSLYAKSRKTNEPNVRKWGEKKQTNLGPDFGLFGPNLGAKKILLVLTPPNVRHCCKPLLYVISQKTNEQNLRKWQKKLVSETILAPLTQIQADNFFFFSKIWLQQSLDIMVNYHHLQYQKKLMIQSWEILVTDGWTDRWTDQQLKVL